MLVLVKTDYAGYLGTEQGDIFEKDCTVAGAAWHWFRAWLL
jgi:hypothetical protein